tara:strand:+ start:174 stop:689 length:516 start_codon:yes stop_codon:yes gene_type:complete
MKNLIFTLALLITTLTFAQDGYKLTPETYQAINAKVSNLDEGAARAFADRLAGTSETEFAYMQTKTTEKATKFYYTRTDLTQKEQVDQNEMGCSDCLVVYFKNQPTGLVFDQVAGSFEDLYPTWNREFLPSATVDNVNESFKYREVKDRTTGTDIRFMKANGTWQIYNWTK